MSSSLLISIITPCLNRAGYVAQAVESVQRQDYAQVQHIIMDGGSTDGTLSVLERYPHLQVLSQKDKGIYDAMNQGIQLARGEVIGFLNTDDLYEPGIFPLVAQALEENPELCAVVGGASIFYEKSKGEWLNFMSFPSIPPGSLLYRATQGAPIFNAWFFRRNLFDELGDFNSSYLYVADRDFLIRMALQEKSYMNVDKPFYRYRMHPGSYTLSGRDSGEAGYMFESRALAERYLQLRELSPETFKCFRDWHSQITVEQIRTAVHRRAFHRAISYALTGLRFNIGWPRIFMRKAIDLISENYGKGGISGG